MKKIFLLIFILATDLHAVISKKEDGEIIILTKIQYGIITKLIHNKVAKLYAGSVFMDGIELEIEGNHKNAFNCVDQEFINQNKRKSLRNKLQSFFRRD